MKGIVNQKRLFGRAVYIFFSFISERVHVYISLYVRTCLSACVVCMCVGCVSYMRR